VFDVVVASWEQDHPIGGEVYKWALRHRPDLRAKFVFVSDDTPAELDRVVAGRCLTLRADELEELIRVVEVTVRRSERGAQIPQADLAWVGSDRPALLLVDDDVELLQVMAELLLDIGFQVTASDSGNAGIAQLEHAEFDVVLSDWYMPDGSGADLYRWICTNQPWMLERLMFLTGADLKDAEQIATGVPVLPKGQDSATLIQLITQTARRTRAAS
jgi:CheY-like chemotaxis protein